MSELKNVQVSVKFTNEEKEALTTLAKSMGLNLAQYIRHKVLEAEAQDAKGLLQETTRYERVMLRFVISSYFKLSSLASKQLPQEDIKAALKETLRYYKILDIEKVEGEWDKTIMARVDE